MERRSTVAAVVVAALLGGVAWFAFTRGPGANGTIRDREGAAEGAPGNPALVASDGAGLEVARPVGTPPAPDGSGAVAPPPAAGESAVEDAFLGIVVDQEDRPIAAATVQVVSGWGAGRGIDPDDYPTITTGADGRFRFPAKGDVSALQVTARGAGRAPVHAGVALRRGAENRVVLLPSAPLRVTVVERGSGAPVGEARVLVLADSPSSTGVAADEAVTDARGSATLATPGGRVRLVVLPRHHAPAVRGGLLVGVEGLDLTVAVDVGVTIEGTVVDPAGRPVAGAVVLDVLSARHASRAMTGADGRFVLAHVSARVPTSAEVVPSTMLAAWADGYPRKTVVCFLPSGETRTVEITLRPWASVEGFVRRETGDPVPGATVRAIEATAGELTEARAPDPEMETTTDAIGAFALRRVPPEGGLVAAFERRGGVVTTQTVGVAPIWARDGAHLVIVLGSAAASGNGAAARVRVLDAAGRPLAGAMLEACAVRSRLDLLDRATTDAEGRAALSNLPAEAITLVVHMPGQPTIDVRLDVVAAAREEQIVRLPGGVVSGLVSRPDGSPARVRVRLLKAVHLDGGEIFLGGDQGTPTDEGGAFRFVGVGEGAYFVDVASQGLSVVQGPGAARAGDTDIRLVVATWAEAVDLRLGIEAVDADTGRALELPHLAVDVRRSGTSDIERTAVLQGDGNGLYRDERPLFPGTYDVRVRADGYRDAEVAGVRVTAGGAAARARVSLEPAKRIEGRVLDARGRPVPGPVEVGFGDRRVAVRADGTYSFGVVHEPVVLQVTGDYVASWARRPPPADAPPGAGDHIDFLVGTGGALRVRLKDGREPAKAVVLRASTVDVATGEAMSQMEETIDREWIDAHGASRLLPGLEPGRWRIEAVWDGVALPPRDVEIRDRETITLDVGP